MRFLRAGVGFFVVVVDVGPSAGISSEGFLPIIPEAGLFPVAEYPELTEFIVSLRLKEGSSDEPFDSD